MDIKVDDETGERVKALKVPRYEHTEAGLLLTLHDMTIYLLDEQDFSISPEEFDAKKHEHAIPKFEMARIYILVCARTGNTLGFTPKDRETDPVYPIYEKAYRKLVRTETDKQLFLGIARVGQAAGFLSEEQLTQS